MNSSRDSIEAQVSAATRRNWKRLNVKSPKKKLNKRANKKGSDKTFCPPEYLSNPENYEKLQKLLSLIREKNLPIENVMYSLCLNKLQAAGLITSKAGIFTGKNEYLTAFLRNWKISYDWEILHFSLPTDEADIIGMIYQSLLREGDKNKAGSYYTPVKIVQGLLDGLNLKQDSKVLDPCCGTGIFLMNIKGVPPENIVGIDKDFLAVQIAKVNLFVKYKNKDFRPKVFCRDFLTVDENLIAKNKEQGTAFDFIVTNPPWGASLDKALEPVFPELSSGEIFSYFLIKSYRLLSDSGRIHFLLPESILNIKTHADVRKFILSHMGIKQISLFGKCFSGVLTDVVGLLLSKDSKAEEDIRIVKDEEEYQTSSETFLSDKDYVFSLCCNEDNILLNKLYDIDYRTLKKGSLWALGIVTGNNEEALLKRKIKGTEEILTGKEISPYTLSKSGVYIKYNRRNFQQAAKDEIYRAEEKLIYKFISDRFVFAYDDKKRLFLNSANILIPYVKGMSIKTVLAFLNSDVFQYINIKKFKQIKVLKGNLQELPFPYIMPETDKELSSLVDGIISKGAMKNHAKIQALVYEQFKLTPEEIKYIEKCIKKGGK